jgi:hypothetical protein
MITPRPAVASGFALVVALATVGWPASTEEGSHWVGTWCAAPTARVDLPVASTSSPGAASAPRDLPIPPGVLAVAPNQILAVAGQSLLHFDNQTLRQIVHLTLGGSRFRVVLSNTFGTAPLTIGAVQVALRDKDASILPGSSRALTFGGRAQIAVPARFSSAIRSILPPLTSPISRSTCTFPGTRRQ